MPKRKLPKKLFMRWSGEGEDAFLDHSVDPDLLAETGMMVEAGVYELTQKVRLINTTKIEKI